MTYETPGLTRAQQVDFAGAETVALMANEAFDRRLAAAKRIVEVGIAAVPAFKRADEDFSAYDKAAEVLMPPSDAFEVSEPIEPFASETVWSAMSPEQRKRATEIRAAVAAGPLAELGVTADTLRVLMTGDDDNQKFHLFHTGNGVDIGDPKKNYDPARSYNSVMSNANNGLFRVKVGGITYDSREGMTDLVYAAMVADAKERGVTLPDSEELAKETGDDWTYTMLTGEPLTAGGIVQVRLVDGDGRVSRSLCHPDDGSRSLRVCPVVEI